MDVVKRGFDLITATLLFVLLSPVLLAIALLVVLNLGRPVIYSQHRPGLHGTPFRLYKFRTMSEDDPSRGDAERLTPFGRLLRSASLDELPELWNVVTGDMSLVGPRPLLMEYLPLYNAAQARRHDVKPGITGWAQVNGRNAISWPQKFELDLWYVDNRTFWVDLRILMKTVETVLLHNGVNEDGSATMSKFKGNQP